MRKYVNKINVTSADHSKTVGGGAILRSFFWLPLLVLVAASASAASSFWDFDDSSLLPLLPAPSFFRCVAGMALCLLCRSLSARFATYEAGAKEIAWRASYSIA